jgi:hypothetical protein
MGVAPGAGQWVAGNQNVQINHVTGSTIRITYGGQARHVPLRPAVVPVGPNVSSPARLVRARSGVIPYAARDGVLADLVSWAQPGTPFATCVVGGRGGSGKTRLGVELCEQATGAGWLAGMLEPSADQGALEALLDAQTARLIVVDYAETRGEQLELIAPLLNGYATIAHPVRLLLLVRSKPREGGDWTGVLRRRRHDQLDVLLDDAEQRTLEDLPLDRDARDILFTTAARALTRRADTDIVPLAPAVLEQDAFSSPLMVVIAAYLAVHGDAVPATRRALLDELVGHEDTYWQHTVDPKRTPEALRRRVVALATLTTAADEESATDALRLLPDLRTVDSERAHELARWAADLYPGDGYWGALEPDLVGEHLVATTLTALPEVLHGVLNTTNPQAAVRPLDVYVRTVPDHPVLAEAVAPVLSNELSGLCDLAIRQAASETDLALMLGDGTLAAAVTRAISVIPVAPDGLAAILGRFPPRPDLILGPLALTLTNAVMTYHRGVADADPAYQPELAASLNNLSNRFGNDGRHEDGLAAAQEAAAIYRRLAEVNPAAYEPHLAVALSNLSNRLADMGRHEEGLAPSQEAVTVSRSLAAVNPAAHEPHLAAALNNLSIRIAGMGRAEEGLAASQEAVTVRRRLAKADPATHEPHLAAALNNLSNRLGDVERDEESLDAIQETVALRRRLAGANPAAYEPDLARSLSNLSGRLGEMGRGEEGLAASEEAVAVYRRLADADPAAHEPHFSAALNNLSNRLGDAGRPEEGLAAIQEAVAVCRRLAEANPGAHEGRLARSLYNLSIWLANAGRRDEAIRVSREAAALGDGAGSNAR